MMSVPLRTNTHYVSPLPTGGDWRLHPALNGQCIVAADLLGRFMPKLIVNDVIYDLLAVDQQTYLEFLIDTGTAGRMH